VRSNRRRRAARRRILAIIAGSVLVAAVAALFLLPGKRPEGQAAPSDPRLEVRAYLVATGVFAQPASGRETGTYAAAQQAAQNAGADVAYTIWTDQDSFETQGWRDIIGVHRVPISRPPKIDFVREILILAWPLASKAPSDVLQAPGLTIHGAALQQHGVALAVGPATNNIVATPVGGGSVLPYALVSVPRNQWPIPAAAPDVPPLVVTLTR
jgi:hypothetical protein